ncbi:MAG: ABC transporter ATP-binding protein [Deltaproteobacteria bacterium]|nr:ABC transporter ATP-binding protein [Deltaproteobacteria bacterium]
MQNDQLSNFIELKNIQKSFGTNLVLRDVSLSVGKGEFVTFLGPSGCGKTTLLRCLAGLETVDRGLIFLDGTDITYTPANRRGIHMLFQQYCLFPTMDVFSNVSFGLRMASRSKPEVRKAVGQALEMVDLIGHEKKYPHQLSGGEQQRTALARCLVMNPRVLLLDEPFSAIDAKLRKELQLYLKRIHRELHMTSVFVTHDQEEAMRISDTIHLFNLGRLEQSGTPGDVYAAPKTAFVAGFIGSYNLLQGSDFGRITESGFSSDQLAAFRPEAVRISPVPFGPDDGFHQARGRITDSIPQGNVTRYAVGVDGVTINVDVLFNSSQKWSRGQDVFFRIGKEDVLAFKQ